MPVHPVTEEGRVVGYRWGEHGKVYRSRAKAEAQARAIFASGYREDLGVAHARRQVAKELRPNRIAELQYKKHLVGVMRGVHAGILQVVDREVLPEQTVRHDAPGDNRDGIADRAKRVLTPRLREKVAGHVRKKVAPAYDQMAAGVDKKHQRAVTLIGIPLADAAGNVAGQVSQMREDNIRLFEDASRDYVDDVRDVLTDPRNEGLTITALRDKVRSKANVSLFRAALIATDQTLKLSSGLNRIRQVAAGVTTYRWSTSRDERVRGDPGGLYPKADPSHYALEGEEFSWADPPPADVDGGPAHPGEAINCRCVAIPIIEELDEPDDEAAGVDDDAELEAAE